MVEKAVNNIKGRMSRHLLAGMLIMAALLAGAYAWFGRTPPGAPGGPRETVSFAVIVYPGACPLIVAQAKGYFANEGVLAKIETYPSGKASLDAVFRGQADFGTAGDIPTMFAVMGGQPLSVVATIARAENDLGIVGRKDKGVVAPTSLKGKRVGVTLGTGGHFVLDAFLTQQKLSAAEVKVRDLKPEQLADALAKGEIDAASTWQPHLGALQSQLGGNGTAFLSQGLYDVAFNLAGTQGHVASHPETVKKILRALVSAGRFCKDDPDGASEILAEAFKTGAASLKALWPAYRFDVALDQSLLLALEDESRWAIKNRLTDRTDMPNYLRHVHLDALKAVAPAAVTVIH